MTSCSNIYFALFFSLASSCFGQKQDLQKNYLPLKSEGLLPGVFTQNIREVIEREISELGQNKDEDKRLKTSFLTLSNYEIERILRSGNVLVNDEVTKYLNEIADVILKEDTVLRKKLNIFALKSTIVNAYSYDKGYIFIDLALIAQMESEAQLAYVLSHEISHYTKQHHINSFVTNNRIDNEGYGSNKETKYIVKCQYSKEYESEADLEGLHLYLKTNYDLQQAEKSFAVLQYAHLPFQLLEFRKSYFETPNYVFPQQYFLKEVSPIKDNSFDDDSEKTHPNASKRRVAVTELISKHDNSGRVMAGDEKSKFEYIRDLSRMELCRLYLKNRDYPNALYASYILSNKYPNNQYVAEQMAKSLYGITLYSNGELRYGRESYLDEGISKYDKIESFPQQIYYMIEKMPGNEWAVLSLNQVYRMHKKHPGSKELELLSDSLFGLMSRINWGIPEFEHTVGNRNPEHNKVSKSTIAVEGVESGLIGNIQKKISGETGDTNYFRSAFVDLFGSDTEFSKKFPAQISGSNAGHNKNEVSRRSERGKYDLMQKELAIDTLLLVEPFYVSIDERFKDPLQYVSSEEKREKFVAKLDEVAKKLQMVFIKIDPSIVQASEVDMMNDFSVINDWFDERFDSGDEGRVILNTSEIERLTKKYGSSYVLKTGVASVIRTSGSMRTYFFGFLFDIKKNELIYRKYEVFKGRDKRDLVNSKTYEMLFEIGHPVKKRR